MLKIDIKDEIDYNFKEKYWTDQLLCY